MRRAAVFVALCLALPGSAFGQEEVDLTTLDLSGAWYVLIHFKDQRSEDKGITKFKDFALNLEQTTHTITLEQYPFVLFDEDTELVRRQAMRGHMPWAPDEGQVARLHESVDVSTKAVKRKRLKGSVAEGFESLAPLTSGGLSTLSFVQNWDITFQPQTIKIVITDSLSGAGGLGGMEDATVYSIRQRVSDDELRGTYSEATKHGTIRMIRGAELRVLK
jgi:hypothetical protein